MFHTKNKGIAFFVVAALEKQKWFNNREFKEIVKVLDCEGHRDFKYIFNV